MCKCRTGCIYRSACRHSILALPSLVVLLPHLSWYRYHQCCRFDICVPVQNTRRYDTHIYCLTNTVKPIHWAEVYAESGQEAGEVGTARGSKYRQIMGLKTVHILAFFLLVYVGTEVSGQFLIMPLVENQLTPLRPGYHRRYAQTVQSFGKVVRLMEVICDVRLDRNVHHPRTGRREQCRLHILWVLWRYNTRPGGSHVV